MLDAVEIKVEPPDPHSNKQRLIMEAFNIPGLRKVYVSCGTKFGKAYYYETLTPTPDRGFIPVKDIRAGDFVFDEHGKPTRVVYATPLRFDHACYEVTFSDGTQVIADAEHDWVTTTHAERKNMARVRNPADRVKSTSSRPMRRNTEELYKTQTVLYGGRERPNHAVDNVSGPLQFNAVNLPIPPYTLGAWLGDGCSWSGSITNPDPEIIERIRAEGFEIVKGERADPDTCPVWHVQGLPGLLREHGLLRNKHVPSEYLSCSTPDRMAFLQGLMDTDGTVDKRGHSSFDNTNKSIADAVAVIAATFGIKAHRSERVGRLNGEDKKLCYRVWFTTDYPVFSLPRKAARLRPVSSKARHRMITSIRRVESVPVMCLQVENPSHLFLITESCIPTHNSLSASACLSQAALGYRNSKWRWIAPIYEQAKVGMDYFRKMLPPAPHSEFRDGDMRILLPRINTEIQFWHCKNPVSLEGPAIFGNVFDEAAKCPYEAVASAQTTVTMTRGPQLYASTPYGKNWFYRECMEAKDHMEWSVKRGETPSRIFIRARTIDNPFVDPQAVLEAKRALPDRLFRQYYLAEFVDDGSVFIGFRDVLVGPEINVMGSTQYWVDDAAAALDVFIGVDWAKKEDYTVITALSLVNGKPRLVGFLRFQGVGYVDALKELYKFIKKFKNVVIIKHDRTGVGEAIDDMLSQLTVPFEGVVFTNASKAAMVNQLIMSIETRDIQLVNWPEMVRELESYTVETNDLGTARYSAPRGMHDDIVSSLMLAHAAAQEYAGEFKLHFLEDLPKEKATVQQWYNNLIADLD